MKTKLLIVTSFTIDKFFEIYIFFENTFEIYKIFEITFEIHIFFEYTFEIWKKCQFFEKNVNFESIFENFVFSKKV